MKKLLLTLSTLLTMTIAQAQVIAGSIPSGTYTLNPNVNLSIAPCQIYDSSYFDINCDNVADFKIRMYKGINSVDEASYAFLFVLNDTIEICSDTVQYMGPYKRPHYYNLGDTLNCPSNAQWKTDSAYQFGYFGCMLCNGPGLVSNKYFAYKKGTQIRWVKVSFNLSSGSCIPPITFSITSVLVSCTTASINNYSFFAKANVFPNPTSDQFFIDANTTAKLTVDLYDANGRHVFSKSVSDKSNINVTDLNNGVYTLTIKTVDRIINKKIVIVR